MTWIKIDDSFPDHPKIIGLSDKAFRSHIQALCYCGRFLTDGVITSNALARLADRETIAELLEAGLWRALDGGKGYVIHDYLEHQTSKNQVEHKRELSRERTKRYREKHSNESIEDDDWDSFSDAEGNALVTTPEYRIQNTEHRIQNTDTNNKQILPRVKSAKESVERISNKLGEARANGINAWNLSKLVEDEWDTLHTANDIGGCIALTAWYVSELQTRQLTSSEIGRIGQMTKRFGRIALLAIDEAASKDLTDLVSYAFRIAQNMYAEKKPK